MGHVTLSTPILGAIWLGLDTAYLCSKRDNSSFSRSIDMVMVYAHQNLNGSRDVVITPISGMVCHPRAQTLATISLSTNFEVS